MQTFLPYPGYTSVAMLDSKRLGKQRVEAWQILRTLIGESEGWVNHPAVRMWRGHVGALAEYGYYCCVAWRALGYKDTLLERMQEAMYRYPDRTPPAWLGREDVHASHRSALLRKNFEYYSQYNWNDDPSAPYVWPV